MARPLDPARESARSLELFAAQGIAQHRAQRREQASPLSFEVTAPVGVRYGDRVEIRLAAELEDERNPAQLTLACVARQAVLAIKTSRGYEREVADTLLARAEEKPDVVFALLVPPRSGATSSPRG